MSNIRLLKNYFVYLLFILLFLSNSSIIVLFASAMGIKSLLGFIPIKKAISPFDVILYNFTIWQTWIFVGIFATVSTLLYLNHHEHISLKKQPDKNSSSGKVEKKSKEVSVKPAITELGNRLNVLLSELSEVQYEEDSDFDIVYENAISELDKYLDESGKFSKKISVGKMKRLVRKFEEVSEYETTLTTKEA